MQDPPADPGTVALLERVASGSDDWDEQRLGPIIDQNVEAIHTMQRATKLPECNWALEYEMGAETPVAHLAKARVLSRLNVLYGTRMAAKGEMAQARDAFLAGLRFAQHLVQGSSLIGALTAKAAMLSDLQALNHLIRRGALKAPALEPLQAAVQALPEFGFDWSESLRFEAAATVAGLKRLAESPNPNHQYEFTFGEPAPGPMPSAADLGKFQEQMNKAAAAMRQPLAQASTDLLRVQEEINKLNRVVQRVTPSLSRVIEARTQLELERKMLLDAMSRSNQAQVR